METECFLWNIFYIVFFLGVILSISIQRSSHCSFPLGFFFFLILFLERQCFYQEKMVTRALEVSCCYAVVTGCFPLKRLCHFETASAREPMLGRDISLLDLVQKPLLIRKSRHHGWMVAFFLPCWWLF